MSICNVWADANAALIAVDTATLSQPDRKAHHRSKVLALPHARMVLACRGETLQFGALFFALSTQTSTFDEAVSLLPKMLSTLSTNANRTPSIPGVDLTLELFVAGWSETSQTIRLLRYLYQPGGAFEADESGFGVYLSLCDPDEQQIGYALATQPDFQEQLPAFMARQAARGRESHPDVAFGGRILLTTLTRDFIQTVDLGEIP